MSESEVRELLERVLAATQDSESSWYTGEIDFELKSGRTISGTLRGLEDASAVIDGPSGLQTVVLKSVNDVAAWMASPGLE